MGYQHVQLLLGLSHFGIDSQLGAEAVHIRCSQCLLLYLVSRHFLIILLIHKSTMLGLSVSRQGLLLQVLNETFQVVVLYGLQLMLVDLRTV